jgi:hypothetical protein
MDEDAQSGGLYTLKGGFIFLGLFIFLIVLYLMVQVNRADCYEGHKLECEQAHELNKTYLYCSGFQVESTLEDMDTYCAIHPNESCLNIPHGCVLQENEYIESICIKFTKLCLEVSPY